MADVTGTPVPTGASPFRVPEDLEAIASHFGDASMFAVASVSALPASGNWLGRSLLAVAEKAVYVCTALPGTWTAVSGLEDTGWIVVGSGGDAPGFGSGWSPQTGSGWSGLRFRRKLGVLHISGSVQKTSYGALTDAIFTLPAQFRPATRFMGVSYGSAGPAYIVVEPTGVVASAVSGTGQVNLSATVPL